MGYSFFMVIVKYARRSRGESWIVPYKQELNLSSIAGATSAIITGILVGDVNNSWLIPT